MSRGKVIFRKEVRFIEEVRMSWNEMIEQFREITNIVQAVENSVLESGRLDSRVVDKLIEPKNLTPMGLEFLKSLVQQSEKIMVLEDEGLTFLIPNPDYEPTEVRAVEDWKEENTKPDIPVNDIPVTVDGAWVKKVHKTRPIIDVPLKKVMS